MMENLPKAKDKEQKYACELPAACPPIDAFSPRSLKLYRALQGAQPTSEDFISYRELHPQKKISEDECICRGLSLLDSVEGVKKILKLPRFRNGAVGVIILESECGVVKQTGKKGHFTWWRFYTYDSVVNCKVEN